MTDALYQLTNVTRRLSKSFRLHVDGLVIPRGGVIGLVGPTGAGKTTLLRLLTGLQKPDDGTIIFDGTPLDATSPLAVLREITMVHQRPILIDGSVEHNVAYGLRARGRDAKRGVAEILQRLGLSGIAKQDARSLSGGQTQLVALARALVFEPSVLLLDEPTANLDPGHVGLVERVIGDIQADRMMTVVWATHNLFQARRMSQHAMLVLGGSVVEVGDNKAFFESPADPRTAAFIDGKMVY
jgi:tungstate transport system ATP-binding protein